MYISDLKNLFFSKIVRNFAA